MRARTSTSGKAAKNPSTTEPSTQRPGLRPAMPPAPRRIPMPQAPVRRITAPRRLPKGR
ncbi:hypothetical protein [Sphaerisporangium sp. TRM90804]|uniref:hypothetical protein n=1 Tax=Sphaerisporangium sp. TRM90804 TaxID=3031113 RepID=UPI00244B0836|nr:hypothetical protein [Sphaerisporangium sp. TRM90804]MDH2427069.1 hypothetical protein [Sphaerisporangium sp. TRM90804]